MELSDKTIEYLRDLITGDSKRTDYKTGSELVKLFNMIGFNDEYGEGFPSRWNYVQQKLEEVNGTKKLREIIELFFAPINFVEYNSILLDIVNTFNQYLAYDGYKIEIKNKKVYVKSISFNKILVRNTKKLGSEFAKEQLEKCDEKVSLGDYDGAITNARSLIEDIIKDIYKRRTGKKLKSSGDLIKDYRELKKILNLSVDKSINDSLKQILSGINSIINGVASIRNKMGDGHARTYEPLEHHSKLIVNSAKTLSEFLYDTYLYQKENN